MLLVLEGAAFSTALGSHIPTAAAYADVLCLAVIVTVVGAALDTTLNLRLYAGILLHGVLARSLTPLFKRSAAGLAAFPSRGSVYLDPRQTALVVLIMLATGHLTFQSVHTRHLVFTDFCKT